MAFFGIDLGTSSCLVARLTEGFDEGDFSVRCLKDDDGDESFPSVISFLAPNQYVVGEKAVERLVSAPDSTVELIKVRLGTSETISITANNTRITKSPQELTGLLLKHLKDTRDVQINEAVLTVPAFFDQSQKDATMSSGRIAGINVQQLIEEPTAALMYQIFADFQEKGEDFFGVKNPKVVLVFDFGGGTLDLSLIRLTLKNGEVKPDVLAIGGDQKLGGNTIDFLFTKTILNTLAKWREQDKFLSQASAVFDKYFSNYQDNRTLRFPDGVPEEIKAFIFRLKRNLEQVKISLSTNTEEKIFIGRDVPPIPITRKDFESLIIDESDIGLRIERALNEIAAVDIPIDEVLLIGGSSQIPYLRKLIVDAFKRNRLPPEAIRFSSDYSQAVAKGAAIQAALRSGQPIPPFRYNQCTSIVPRDILLYCGSKPVRFIDRGTPYPFPEARKMTIGIPHALSENIPIRLSEVVRGVKGEQEEKPICDYSYYLPLYYTNDQIAFSMNIDSAGLYEIQATHIPTRERVAIEPHKHYSLSDEECVKAAETIERMIDQSKRT